MISLSLLVLILINVIAVITMDYFCKITCEIFRTSNCQNCQTLSKICFYSITYYEDKEMKIFLKTVNHFQIYNITNLFSNQIIPSDLTLENT